MPRIILTAKLVALAMCHGTAVFAMYRARVLTSDQVWQSDFLVLFLPFVITVIIANVIAYRGLPNLSHNARILTSDRNRAGRFPTWRRRSF